MAEPGRFKSLRKKRPSVRPNISAPVSQTSVSRSPARNERTEQQERMQRRMSQKLMQPINFGDAPPMPGLPSHAAFQKQRPAEGPAVNATGKVQLDMAAIEDPSLDPEAYVMSILRHASADQMAEYAATLARMQNRNSADIQESVHKNVDAFINVSDETKNIKSEMDNLRNYMSELRILISQNNAALGLDAEEASLSRRHANRSSIANLEAMWSTHLQELWKRVEGSQKYLPAIPGRHIAHESGKWIELNPATLRPRRRIYLILLNDHLLVASEKTRAPLSPQMGDAHPARAAQTAQLVCDHCWPLQDVEVSELSAKITTGSRRGPRATVQDVSRQAMNLRVGSESFTYAATDRDAREKSALMRRIRKATADLRKALHVDNEDKLGTARPASRGARDSLAQARGGTGDAATARANAVVDVDGKQEKLRWVEGQVYELEIDVALQRFEAAVARVERLRGIARSNRGNTAVQELVNVVAARHVDKLVGWLAHYLAQDQKARSKVQGYTAWLRRLDLEQLASRGYLQARSDWIQHLTE